MSAPAQTPSAVPGKLATPRLPELEALRGLMALWVIVVHSILAVGFNVQAWPGALRWIADGDHPVFVFILLSGFVIFNLLDNARESYGVYLTRRFLRLFPAYFVCLIAASLMLGLSVDAINNMPWHPPFAAVRLHLLDEAQQHYWAHLLSHLTLLHGAVPPSVLPDAPYTILGQAWSISLEWQFYLLAPLCLYLARRYDLSFAFGMMLAVILIRRLAGGSPAFVFTQFEYFAVGALSYFGWKYQRGLAASGKTRLVYACAALLAFSFALLLQSPALAIWLLVVLALCGAGHGLAGAPERSVLAVLQFRVTRYLGKVSYSLYLVHMIALYAMMYLLGPRFADVSQWHFWILLFGLTAGLSIAAASVMFHFIEQPFINLGRRLSNKAST